MEVWLQLLIATSGVMVSVVFSAWKLYHSLEAKIRTAVGILREDGEKAHRRIEGNIKDSEDRVTASVRADVDRLYAHIKDSESRVTASVKADVDRLYTRIEDSENKVATSVKADVDRIYGQIDTLITLATKKDG